MGTARHVFCCCAGHHFEVQTRLEKFFAKRLQSAHTARHICVLDLFGADWPSDYGLTGKSYRGGELFEQSSLNSAVLKEGAVESGRKPTTFHQKTPSRV